MNEGKIAYLGKGFGFIKIADRPKDLFFHAQNLDGVRFEDLRVNDSIVFDSIDDTHKGPAAMGVRLA